MPSVASWSETGVLLAIAIAGSACAALPNLSFQSDDGGATLVHDAAVGDGGPATSASSSGGGSSGSSASSSSGSSSSGGTSSSGADASSGGSDSGSSGSPACPAQVPPSVTTCCGDVPCVGKKCAGRCADCGSCATGDYCCVPDGTGQAVTCVASAAACN